VLLLYAVAAGLLAGRVSGGRFAALGEVRFHWWPLALGGLAFQVLLFNGPLGEQAGDAAPAMYVASTLVVLAALLRDVRLPGFGIIALGAGANLLAIVANGGLMPADPAAFAALTGQPVIPTTEFTNSTLAGGGTHFPWLGDIFVLPRPIPLANVFSLGDALIALGAALFLVRVMHRRDPATSVRVRIPGEADGVAG
jgi:hypothetical protein